MEEAKGPETQKLVKRLKSIEGHVRGIERMIEDGAYCVDVVHRVLAVQKALSRVNALVLDRHLHTCVTEAIRGDDRGRREKVLGEILEVFEAKSRS